VLHWLPDAARQAAAERSHREAIIHLEALEPHLDLVPVEQRAELLELFASEEEYADGRGVRHAMAALELRRQLGEPSGLGTGLLCAHRAVWTSGDFAHAAELAREAVEVLEEVGGEDLALAYGQLARVATQNFDPDLAVHYCERALELAPEPSRARALALSMVGVQRNLTDYPEGRELLEEAAAIAESLGLAWELQRARGNLIETALAAKDVERARRDNQVALASLDADIVTTLWHVHAGAKIDTAAGDHTAAEPVVRDLLRTGRIDGTARWFAEATLAKVLVRAGSSDAKRAVERLWDGARTAGQVQDRTTASTVAAEYLWVFRARDADLTARNLSAFEDTVNSAARWYIGDQALWLWLDGHLDAIPERAAEPVRWVGDGQWKRAADWFGDRGVPFEQAVALSTGDVEARLEALRIAQRIGARALAARLRDDLRADGVTGLPRGPRHATRRIPLGLTPRQFEVLSLLAEGLPNAEIADRLFVSLRTVENHVSAILTRLGVSNREEAVAVATERGGL
jgi:DNA-binding CsgD family transcriptional regulator/tetratricopeptide (TPR) repeat protein